LPEDARWSPDGRLYLELGPLELAHRGLYEGRYEAAERAIVERLVSVGDTCVDIGASFGIYTILLASLVGPQGRVIAFEPSPPAYDRLKAACGSVPWIGVNAFALGATAHEATIAVTGGDAMHSTMRRTAPLGACPHQVAVKPLTRFIGTDERIPFVKLDVEGYEAQVLEGMWPLFVGRNVDALMVEAEPGYGDLAWIERLQKLDGYGTFSLSLKSRRARWRPRLAPVGLDEPVAGTVFLIKLTHPRLAAFV
jgi:FkbM family methyltransferase